MLLARAYATHMLHMWTMRNTMCEHTLGPLAAYEAKLRQLLGHIVAVLLPDWLRAPGWGIFKRCGAFAWLPQQQRQP